MMNCKEHWEEIYRNKGPLNVSWYQQKPVLSLELIKNSGVEKDAGIIDIGGGASVLVDFLLEHGYSRLAVLDWSSAALEHARTRLGERAKEVQWFEADVRSFQPQNLFGLWHDRAVFHFLTEKSDRQAYIETLRKTLKPSGSVIIATFSLDGPRKCSGLDVVRYDEQAITAELGKEFELQEVRREIHLTPWQSEQSFIYFRFKRCRESLNA
jgi:ubiquinone/menaquinone biosynthesis C-methylase UbiE